WDECFPAIAPSRYVGHPYDGIPVPDHGELWGLPTTAVPARANDGITTVWQGLRFGYTLSRKLYLDGSTIAAEYTLLNRAPFPFHFVWSMHALLAMEVPVELKLPDGLVFEAAAEADAAPTKTFRWPILEEHHDLSRPA